MNEETEKFHDMLQDFERYCSIKLKKEAVSSFVQLLKWLAKHEPTASSRGKEWQHFIAYCRCQIVSCYATLLMQRLQQAGNRAGLSEANTIILVCYSYSMVLQLAPSLKSIPKDTWWSANCVFCILEAHQMLSSLLLKREVKEEFFAALKSSALTDLVAKTAAIFTLNPRFKTDELFGMFGDNPCQRKVDLDVDAYRSAIRYLIRHDTTPVALKRLVWILLFSWDPGKELIMRNDHEDAFDMLPYAPGDFADTSFENLTVLDISVFIHLSVFAAASSKGQLEKLPFVLSCNVAVKKMREAVWTSVNAYVAGRTGPKDVENIKQFLCYIRLTQRPLPCLSLLHTAAKMIYNKTDELGSFLTKDAKLKVIDYCNAYWCAIEDIIKGEKRAQDDSYRFAFCERPFSSEEQQSMMDESFFYRAKLLLHRGEPIEAERMLRNCTSPTAARLHLELCKQLADSIDSNDPSLENQCRKENYQKLISNISEKLSTGTDGFDESILSNQEASLIESATKQKFTFAKKESRKPTDFQSNEPTFVGRHHEPKNCECRESFEKLFDAYQQILLKFGSVIETIPDMFSTSVKCIADQNKELMLFLQDLLKSGTLTTEKKAPQTAEFEQYLKMLLNYFPSHPGPAPASQSAMYGTEPAQSYPFFSSSFAPAAGQQFPLLVQPTQPGMPPSSINPVPSSTFLQPTASLSGWPNVFNFGSLSQPPPAMQTVQSVSVGLESVGSTGKVLFPKLAAAQTPPSAVVPSANVTHTDKGFFSNLPAAVPKQIASTTAAFSGIATPASTTLSQFDKTGYRDVKFGFGAAATFVTRANEIPSSTQKNQSTFGTVGKDSQATTKSFPFGGVSFGIPKSMPSMPTAGPKAETKGAPTKGGEDVTDTAAVQKPFSLIQPAVLSVPLVTGAPLFSSSTAKSDVPVLRSSWPPTKAQEAAKEVPQKADQKPSTFSQPPVETTVKPNGCIPGAQLKSFIEAQKSAVSDSKPPATVGLSVEESGQASESEESEEENSTHYEPLVPLPDLVDVVTGEEEEEVIFKERAKMFRYHKELGMYKECGVGDLKLLKHPKTNKYRIVMRRDMVHKICANQLLHAEMRLRPMANCENSYCWIANDYSGDELVTALFAARFRNEQAALNFKETIEKCVAEVKLQDEETARREQDVESSSPVQSLTVSKQDEDEGEVPTPTKGKALSSKELSSPEATSTPLKGEEKEKVETAATKQSESSSFGKAKEGANLSFGQSVLSNTLVLERLTPRGGIFSFPKTDSKQEDSKPGSTVLSTPTQEASVSEEEKKSDDDDAYDDSYEPNVTFEPIVPLPDLVDVVTGEEDSEVLFCERTRLFRVAPETKEYKERGTGNLKILKDTHTGRIRLVMRRDVILNVIANHWITADMHLNKHKTASNAYFWHCQNYFGEGDVAYETVAAKFKNEEAANNFYSQFMSAVEADRAKTQSKGKDVVKNGFQESKAVVDDEDKKGGFKFELPPGSWICSSCSVPNDAIRTCCVCCNEAKPAAASKKSVSVSSSESKERPPADNRSFSNRNSTSTCSYSQGTPSPGVEVSRSSVDAASMSADVSSPTSTTSESYQAKTEVSAENADNNSTSTVVEHEDEQINLYPAVQRLLQRYGYMLKVETAWPDVLFKGVASLSFQTENNNRSRNSVVKLQIEQQLKTCSYGRITAYDETTKTMCCNHFIKEVIRCHKRKHGEWSWSVMDRSTGELKRYTARFASAEKMNEFLRAWKEAKGCKESKLASSLSSKAISVLSTAFSKRTAERYSKLARQLHLSPDFFEYLLKDSCTGCLACESFKEERSPDILIFDQPCLFYLRDREMMCRIEVWYLEKKQCYWTKILNEETEAMVVELYESEPFSDISDINRAKLRIGCNLEVHSCKSSAGITFLNESAFDEFRHTFMDTSCVSWNAETS